MSDIFASYRDGLERLRLTINIQHPHYARILTLEQRLLENLDHTQQFGDNDSHRVERSRIIDALNRLTLEAIGKSFNELFKTVETEKPSEGSQFNQRDVLHPKTKETQSVKDRLQKGDVNEDFTTVPYLNYENDDRESVILEVARYLMKKEEQKEVKEQISYARIWFRSHREQIEGYQATVLQLSNFLKLNLYDDLETLIEISEAFTHLSSEVTKLLQVVQAVDAKSPSSQRRHLCNDLRRIRELSSNTTVLLNALIDAVCAEMATETLGALISQNLLLMRQLINNVHQWLSWMIDWFDTLETLKSHS